jgi:orotidine-5'-phosphate decarboxylase
MKTFPSTPWLFPEERREVVQGLVRWGMLKFDNARNLPLKKGGRRTDVYINLRDARNNPRAIQYVTDLFALPMQRVRPELFVEIPDAVSCFAGPLSIQTGIPYLTIREQAKEGRATNAKVIGEAGLGARALMFDDVITDGASKIEPWNECKRLGLDPLGLVVLVDRQQGWRENFRKAGFEGRDEIKVWPGMTLHDVRRELVEMRTMQRCIPAAEKLNPIIVALDGKEWDEILPVIDELRPLGCILKVNDLLFDEGMRRLIPDLHVYGRVMADLKGHDIPATVENTCKRLARHKVWAVTVHSSGHDKMVEAAKKALDGSGTLVLAVTVLTSMDEKTCEEVYHRRPLDQVVNLAGIARRAGADGFVCSPEEVKELRRLYPDAVIVTPGVRSDGAAVNDQKRIATPKGAREAGANYLVMGRQILGAADPVAEVRRVLKDEIGVPL